MCFWALIRAARELGYTVTDLEIYGREPQNDGLYKYLELNCGPPKGWPWA